MTTRFTAALFLLLFFRAVSVAQIAPSDSLFNNDQVVQVDLHFGNDDFWSTLVQHYENDLGETLVADVTISDQTGSRMYYNVEVALKGNSSYGHPGNKKSFKIDLNDNIQGQKYHGMAKVHFNNCWSDPTFMREKVFFDYCRDQGVFAPRVLYANVSMNGTYWGFYDLVEAVDKDFLDRWMDDNNGNLFKAADNFGMGGGGGGGSAEADLAYHGPSQISYATRYELKTNETQNDWSDLIVFVGTLNNSTDAELLTALPTSMSWENTLRSLALDNIFGNLDSYINSARNYYVYHDSTNFLWNWIKWDGNMAFGSYPAQGQNALTLSPTYVANNRPLLQKIMAIPELRT
ncbi:MAG TPA: CotH kinase family protein, partial [Flavobacteriales bacterium]|nr:CotH kinase family protein [Flavobacteriales bacterium]